ncbi:serine/threonine protein kinase (plasmid) [Scytonema sp. HK-05]|nr:serine/threonine protein kinase [Scytonema sp. HK-05]
MKSPSQPDPLIGQVIDDRQRYRLEKHLEAGGMGNVFLAMDTLLGQQVALKLLKDTLVTSEEMKKRFEREVAVCVALKSEHIIQITDYGVTPEGYPFYVMEYLQGQSLKQLLKQEHQISVEKTVSIITQVCDGLRPAHQGVTLWKKGATTSVHIKVVHRNLKPNNILLVPTTFGELVKILDFGIAKIRQDSAELTQLTQTFRGTHRYAAPEQLQLSTDLDGRADIYSLGVIIYEMLSATDPFGLTLKTNTVSEMSWALAHTTKTPVPLRSHSSLSELSPQLEAVVMKCLEKLPSDRFATVDELKQALEAAIVVKPESPFRLLIPPNKNLASRTSQDNDILQPVVPTQPGIITPKSPPISFSSSSVEEVPDATIAQSHPSVEEVPDATIVQSHPSVEEVPDATVAQSHPSVEEVPDANGTIVQSTPSMRVPPEATIVQSTPSMRVPPEATIVQSTPSMRVPPEATIAQSTPSRQTFRSRSILTQTILIFGISIAVALVIFSGIYAYRKFQHRQQNSYGEVGSSKKFSA